MLAIWFVLLATLMTAPNCFGQDDAAAVDRRIDQLSAEIVAITQALTQTQNARDAAMAALADAERSLSDIERQVASTQSELTTLQSQNVTLTQDLDRTEVELTMQRDHLRRALRARQMLGPVPTMRLLLSGQSTAQSTRVRGSLRQWSQHLSASLQQLQTLQVQQRRARAALDRNRSALLDRQQALKTEREQATQARRVRAAALSVIRERLSEQTGELAARQADRKRLEAILSALNDAVAQLPVPEGDRLPLSRRKGSLAMPMQGSVLHAFGARRSGSQRWQGWVIAAAAGAEVQAVGHGHIVFADWLRGYGLLLIIDHGEGLMSLYGHNETLMARVGDWVNSGQTIATAGREPGMLGEENAIYFELRADGEPQDPAVWVSR